MRWQEEQVSHGWLFLMNYVLRIEQVISEDLFSIHRLSKYSKYVGFILFSRSSQYLSLLDIIKF